MSRSTLIIVAAFFVMIVPFLGFPRSWEPKVLIILGGVILLVELYAVLTRAQEAFFRDYEVNTEVYAERIQGRITSKKNKKGNNEEVSSDDNSDEENLKELKDKENE
ncbi:MAG: hypothetical protein ACQEP6_00080 [Patescibacteria group bacterium]